MRFLDVATIVLLAMPAPQGRLPVVSTEGLARGPYARMHRLLEKTVFGIDVLTVEMRFDEPTRQHFSRIAGGRRAPVVTAITSCARTSDSGTPPGAPRVLRGRLVDAASRCKR